MRASDYVDYFSLERYLFETVHRRFQRERSLGAFDLMSIVVWKANRSKSKIARRLKRGVQGREDLEAVARRLTSTLYRCGANQERLATLRDWGFRLPMASAILSVCWPEEFTVYDVRVCEALEDYGHLQYVTRPDRLWQGYCAFVKAVRRASPHRFSLRVCDRFLYGRSAAKRLEADIQRWSSIGK
jgi:hypothetical protein